MSDSTKTRYIALLKQLKENPDNKALDAKVIAQIVELRKVDLSLATEEELKHIMEAPLIYSGFEQIYGQTGARREYANLGLNVRGITAAPAGTNPPAAGSGDMQAKIREAIEKPEEFAMNLLTGSAGLAGLAGALGGYFLDGGMKGAAKWGLLGLGATMGFEFLTGKGADGKSPLSSLLGGLGGAADGTGNFLGEAGNNIASVFNGEKVQHFFKAMKENPLTTLALVVGAGYGFSQGKGIFGSIFEMGKWTMLALAATWVCEHLLGGDKGRGAEQSLALGGSSRSFVDPDAVPVKPAALPVAPTAAPAVNI